MFAEHIVWVGIGCNAGKLASTALHVLSNVDFCPGRQMPSPRTCACPQEEREARRLVSEVASRVGSRDCKLEQLEQLVPRVPLLLGPFHPEFHNLPALGQGQCLVVCSTLTTLRMTTVTHLLGSSFLFERALPSIIHLPDLDWPAPLLLKGAPTQRGTIWTCGERVRSSAFV